MQPGTKSKYPMIEISEAKEIISSVCKSLDREVIPVQYSYGRVLFEDVKSPSEFPPFRASIMVIYIQDGYAVRSQDTPGQLQIIGAYHPGDELNSPSTYSHKAIYVTTGAPVPHMFDAVVPIELTSSIDQGIQVPKTEQNKWIRAVGSDISLGEVIGHAGDILGASEMGVLISVGIQEVSVVKQLVIGILSTGDELVDILTPIPSGSYIRDTNRLMLQILLTESKCTVRDYGILRDDYQALKAKILEMTQECDMIITTGGVSMGDRDYVKPILEEIGDVKFGRINMKPGKPTTFGCVSEKAVFSLPGNPVSCYATFHLLVMHAICLMTKREYYPVVKVDLGGAKIKLDPERPEYHRAVITWKDDHLHAVSTGNQISSRLISTKNANGLLILKAGTQSATHISGRCDAILIGAIRTYDPSLHQEMQIQPSHTCPHDFMAQQKVSASIAVVTISDGCYRGERQDLSGPELQTYLNNLFILTRIDYRLIPDEESMIQDTLLSLCEEGYDCIITTGGTGFSVISR